MSLPYPFFKTRCFSKRIAARKPGNAANSYSQNNRLAYKPGQQLSIGPHSHRFFNSINFDNGIEGKSVAVSVPVVPFFSGLFPRVPGAAFCGRCFRRDVDWYCYGCSGAVAATDSAKCIATTGTTKIKSAENKTANQNFLKSPYNCNCVFGFLKDDFQICKRRFNIKNRNSYFVNHNFFKNP